MRRTDAVQVIAGSLTGDDLVVCSIAYLWDDWWNHRTEPVANAFSPAVIGSITPVALGLALALPHRRVIALDSDGSMLLNTGVMCTLGDQRPANLTVVVLDNGLYESGGGASSHTARNTDLAKMAAGAGCPDCATVSDIVELRSVLERMLGDDQLGYLVAKLQPGTERWPQHERRPTDGVEDKYAFMRHVERLEGIVIHAGGPPQ
jgi:thiamine pyrophosphate-dependent acetolactate synthase large subunit-like protein